MVQVIVLGVMAGCGVLGIFLTVRKRSIRHIYATLDDRPFPDDESVASKPNTLNKRQKGAHGPKADTLGGVPEWLGVRVSRDLSIAGWTFEQFIVRCIWAGMIGSTLPFVLWAIASIERLSTPVVLPIWVGVTGGTTAVAIQIVQLRAKARAGRRVTRVAVSCFLDLVVLALAGGLGVEGALFSAAGLLDADVARKIRQVLDLSRDSGVPPWDGLRKLGDELDIAELVELAAALSLAGTEGAKVRTTIASKAASMRRHELADAETEANLVTERLFIPGMMVLLGFLIFLGYPAIARISSGL
jgi:tight adherence protein C